MPSSTTSSATTPETASEYRPSQHDRTPRAQGVRIRVPVSQHVQLPAALKRKCLLATPVRRQVVPARTRSPRNTQSLRSDSRRPSNARDSECSRPRLLPTREPQLACRIGRMDFAGARGGDPVWPWHFSLLLFFSLLALSCGRMGQDDCQK